MPSGAKRTRSAHGVFAVAVAGNVTLTGSVRREIPELGGAVGRGDDELLVAGPEHDRREVLAVARVDMQLSARDVSERKRAEEDLRVKAWAITSALNAIAIADLAGNLSYVNPAFLQLWGYGSEPEVAGQAVTGFWQMNEAATEVIATLCTQGRWVGEMTARRKDGAPFEVRVAASLVVNDAGQPICMMAAFEDITTRKRTELALRETQAILQAALDNSQVGIAIADAPDGALRYVNDAGLLIRGGDRQSVVNGIGVDQYVASWRLMDLDGHPLQPDEVPLARAYLFGETCSREFIIRRTSEDDRTVLANAAPIRDDNGKVVAAIVAFLDITERKQAEERLGRTLERLALATQAARLGIWDWDIPRNELVWDDRMYELYGVQRADFAGAYEAWLAGIHPDDRAASDEVSRQAQRGEREYDTEFRVLWPDGTVRVLKAYGQFVRDAAGQPLRMTGVNYDVTARRPAEEALRQLNTELEQRVEKRTVELSETNGQLVRALRAKDEFLATMSHELRTPLTAILGLAELLQMQAYGPLTEKQAYYAQTIYQNGQHLLELINDVLDLAKLAAGKSPLELGPVDPSQACRAALRLTQPQADKKYITIALVLDPSVTSSPGRRPTPQANPGQPFEQCRQIHTGRRPGGVGSERG